MLGEMDLLWKFETRITEVLFLNEMTEKLSYNETDKHLCTTLCFNFAETKRTLKHNKNFPCLSFKNSNYNNYGK